MPFFWLLLVLILFVPMVYAGQKFAPPVSTQRQDVRRMLALAEITAEDRVVDLGAGYGQLIVGAARHTPAQTIVGIELSPLHWLWSWLRVRLTQAHSKVTVELGSYEQTDLGQYDVLLMFVMPEGLKRLRSKFEHELRPGTRVVSYVFPIEGWNPEAVDHPAKDRFPIYRYRV